MTVNTAARDFNSHLPVRAAILHLVACQTPARKCGRVTLGLMNFVTSRTGQGRRGLVTAAPLQEPNMATVDVDAGVWIGAIPVQIFIERLSRDIRVSGGNWPSHTRMTLCTNLDVAVAREFRGIHDRFLGNICTPGLMAGNMFTPRSMAPLAGDTQHHARLFVAIVQWPREGLRIRSVAL